jgi:hypothetical protein
MTCLLNVRLHVSGLRSKAARHGLTAETEIGILENADEYQTFETKIIADYRLRSSIGGAGGVVMRTPNLS